MIYIAAILLLIPMFAPILLMDLFNKLYGAKGFIYGYFVGVILLATLIYITK